MCLAEEEIKQVHEETQMQWTSTEEVRGIEHVIIVGSLCCDYNFVYTLFPAPILHNMDIIIGLVLCTPQSCFATLR